MKPKIHPTMYTINVSCACGNSFETMSTVKQLKVDVCSACHPFFTGTQRFVDTTGRVERFRQKLDAQKKAAEAAKALKASKKTAPKAEATDK